MSYNYCDTDTGRGESLKPQRSCLRLKGGEEQSARLEQSFTQVALDSEVKSFEGDDLTLACCFMTESF